MFVSRTSIRSVCLAAAAALSLLAAPGAASAYWPCGWGGGFYGGGSYGFGAWNNPSYWNGGIYASPLPYYAAYPPVYYSHQITARHYGASPFAWYSGQEPITFVPESAPRMGPMPVMIENPYVAAKPAAAARASTEPQKIVNPFIASSGR